MFVNQLSRLLVIVRMHICKLECEISLLEECEELGLEWFVAREGERERALPRVRLSISIACACAIVIGILAGLDRAPGRKGVSLVNQGQCASQSERQDSHGGSLKM